MHGFLSAKSPPDDDGFGEGRLKVVGDSNASSSSSSSSGINGFFSSSCLGDFGGGFGGGFGAEG